jgi:hypothetical protein
MTDVIAELMARRDRGDFGDRDTIAWSGTELQHRTPKLTEAVMWLCNILDDGTRRVTELQEMADGAHISWRAVLRAAHDLGVITRKVGAEYRSRAAGMQRDHCKDSRGPERVPRGCTTRGERARHVMMRGAQRERLMRAPGLLGGSPRSRALLARNARLRGQTQLKAESIEDALPRLGQLPAVSREQSRDVLAAEPGALCEHSLADSLAHKGDANFLANVVSHSRHVDMLRRLHLAFSQYDGYSCQEREERRHIDSNGRCGPAEFALDQVSQTPGAITQSVSPNANWIMEGRR